MIIGLLRPGIEALIKYPLDEVLVMEDTARGVDIRLLSYGMPDMLSGFSSDPNYHNLMDLVATLPERLAKESSHV